MNYLIVSCTTYDMAGRAMIQGAVNGISQYDKHAHFCSLEQPQHHGGGYIGWYKEPDQNEEAFQWADCILDIAGLHTNQANKYQWLYLRQKYDKPYIFMSQSFKYADPVLFKCPKIRIVARGQRSANRLRNNRIPCHAIAPDLSFLVESKPVDIERPIRRVYNTHFPKDITKMFHEAQAMCDIQIVEKLPQGNMVWEPVLNIPQYYGTPEFYFGLTAMAEEVHCARYQVACAAILAGIKPVLYKTGDPLYDEKYDDLMDYYGKNPEQLREEALVSCQLAWELVNELQ